MSGPSLHIRLFGTFDLVYQRQLLTTVNSPRLQSLLAYLLLHAGSPQLRQHVAFILWPDSNEARARNSLRNLLHQLRQALPDADHFLQTDAETLLWRRSADYTLDVAIFESLLAQSSQQDDALARLTLEQAIPLYQGDLFPGCYEDWIEPLRERLRLSYAAALERLIHLYTDLQEYPLALQSAERLRQHDPLQENAYAHLMRLSIASGDFARARHTFQTAAEFLQAELGVEPGPELRSLYKTALVQPSTPANPNASNTSAAHLEPLVGRRNEAAHVQRLWHALQPGQPQVVLLSGEPGIGKSRLAEEIMQWTAHQGRLALRAHCYAGEGNLAYAPVVEWLRTPEVMAEIGKLDEPWRRELLRLLPELRHQSPRLPTPTPLTEAWQRRQFFEALAQPLCELPQPLLLFLDDWQWCDWETLEWLNFLLRFATHDSLFVLGTLRHDEVSQDQRLHSLFLSWQRLGWLTEIRLGPLDETETIALANQVAGQQLAPTQAKSLALETEGNPLFVVETIRADPTRFSAGQTFVSAPPPASDAQGVQGSLPGKVQAVIEYRLAQLSPAALSLVNIAGVFGRRFTFALLHEASGQPEEEIIEGLDELCARQIIREVDGDAYDFSHDKMREVAYAQLSAARRQYLHRKVGQALTQLPGDDQTAVNTQAAFHFEQANSLDQALRLYLQAAAAAADLHAYHRASQLYGRATELAAKLNLPAKTLIHIYTERGRMLEHAGEFAAATQVYRDLESLARRRIDKTMEATAVAQLAAAYSGPTSIHDLQQAETMLARGLALARDLGDHDLAARLHWSRMVTASHYGQDDAAQAAGEASLILCRQHRLETRLPYVLNDFAINLRLSGRQAEGQAHAEEARAIFKAQGNLPMLADNFAQQAWSDFHQLRFADALRWVEESLALCHRIDNRWNLSLATAMRGLVKSALGEWGDALTDLEESMRIGKAAGFAIAATLIPACCGALLRTLGAHEQAVALHQEALAAAHQQAPFTSPAIEAQLAHDAFAAGQHDAGAQWLQAALAHRPVGAISRAWITLADLPLAAVAAAEATGDWNLASRLVEQTRAEAQQRGLPIYAPILQIAQARCCHALNQVAAAETHLHAAISLAQRVNLVPILWRGQSALARLYQPQRPQAAQAHQQQAAAHVRTLAASLSESRLRHAFLTTPDVQATLASG